MKVMIFNFMLIMLVLGSSISYGLSDAKHLNHLHQFSMQTPDSTNKLVKGSEQLENGLYVVVGVFSMYSNAINYTKHVSEKGYNTNYGVRNDNAYYYVYLYRTLNWENAVEETYRIRRDVELHDAWVMRVGDQYSKISEKELAKAKEAINNNEQVQEPQLESDSKSEEDVVENTADEIKKEDLKSDYFVYLKTYRSLDTKPVQTNIQLIDNKRAKLIRQLKSNQLQGVWDPKNGSSSIKLICNVFGYRKLEHNLKLKQPVSDSTKSFVSINDDIINVDFKLDRLKQGDIAVMYNVYFFNDAAIMRPESKFEVNSLLEMMKENDKMKIKIHGHTNGGKPGKIVKIGKGETNYFNMASTNADGFGSAKDLSRVRAELIKTYMIKEGIAPDRMEVRGWGGKKMLYDKDSPQAKKNIRVEVEILQD